MLQKTAIATTAFAVIVQAQTQTNKACMEGFNTNLAKTGKLDGTTCPTDCALDGWYYGQSPSVNICHATQAKAKSGERPYNGKHPEHLKYAGPAKAAESTDAQGKITKEMDYPFNAEPNLCTSCKDAIYVQHYAGNTCDGTRTHGSMLEPGAFALTDGFCTVVQWNQFFPDDPEKRTIKTPLYYSMKMTASGYSLKMSLYHCLDALNHDTPVIPDGKSFVVGAGDFQTLTNRTLNTVTTMSKEAAGGCQKKGTGTKLNALTGLGTAVPYLSNPEYKSSRRELSSADKYFLFDSLAETINRATRPLAEVAEEEPEKRKLVSHLSSALDDTFSFSVKFRPKPNSCLTGTVTNGECLKYASDNGGKCDKTKCAEQTLFDNVKVCVSTDAVYPGAFRGLVYGKHPSHKKYVGTDKAKNPMFGKTGPSVSGGATARNLGADDAITSTTDEVKKTFDTTTEFIDYPVEFTQDELDCQQDYREDKFFADTGCDKSKMSTVYEPSTINTPSDMCSISQMNVHIPDDAEGRTFRRPVYFYYYRPTGKAFFFATSYESCQAARDYARGKENDDTSKAQGMVSWQTQTQLKAYEDGVCQINSEDPCENNNVAASIKLVAQLGLTNCKTAQTSDSNTMMTVSVMPMLLLAILNIAFFGRW